MNDNYGWVQTLVSAIIMAGAIGGVYATTQSRLAVLDQKVDSLIIPNHKIVTEQEWAEDHASIILLKEKVSVAEASTKDLMKMLSETHKDFTESIQDQTSVLQSLSINMAGLNGRLGGMEKLLDNITKKI